MTPTEIVLEVARRALRSGVDPRIVEDFLARVLVEQETAARP